MLVKVTEHLKKKDVLSLPHKGIVVGNDDPDRLKRVKVAIQGLLEGPIGLLPWIYPWNPSGSGGGTGSSSGEIPELGSELIIEFKYRDIYSPFYTGYWSSNLTEGGAFNEDYPQTVGTRDETGNQVKVNKATGLTEYQHPSGSVVRFQNDGGVTVMAAKSLRFQSEDGQSYVDYDFNAGTLKTYAKTESSLEGVSTAIRATNHTVEADSVKEDISGAKNVDVVGGLKTNVGGAMSTTVTGNKATAVAGSTSNIFSQLVDETFGLGRNETVVLGEVNTKVLAGAIKALITAGEYDINVLVGTLSLACGLGSLGMNTAGMVDLKGLMNTITGQAINEFKAPLTLIGNGTSPVISLLTDPIEDYITGKPKMGVPTILVG